MANNFLIDLTRPLVAACLALVEVPRVRQGGVEL